MWPAALRCIWPLLLLTERSLWLNEGPKVRFCIKSTHSETFEDKIQFLPPFLSNYDHCAVGERGERGGSICDRGKGVKGIKGGTEGGGKRGTERGHFQSGTFLFFWLKWHFKLNKKGLTNIHFPFIWTVEYVAMLFFNFIKNFWKLQFGFQQWIQSAS